MILKLPSYKHEGRIETFGRDGPAKVSGRYQRISGLSSAAEAAFRINVHTLQVYGVVFYLLPHFVYSDTWYVTHNFFWWVVYWLHGQAYNNERRFLRFLAHWIEFKEEEGIKLYRAYLYDFHLYDDLSWRLVRPLNWLRGEWIPLNV